MHSKPKSAAPLNGNSAHCPYCAARSRFVVESSDRNRRTTSDTFRYYQCFSCGLVFMSPIPENLVPFYEGGYQPIPGSLAELREIAAAEKYRMTPISRYKRGGKLLEIGPWIGIFSCNAKDAGFEVTALEMDHRCVEFLNQTLGIRAIQTDAPALTLAALSKQNDTFDVIALWHSLEHLRDPWRVIEEAVKCLNPGGILLIAIPNIESYQFSVLKSAWKHLDAPRHLFFYPSGALVALCRKHGLSSLEMTAADELSVALSRDTWHSLANSVVPVRYVRGILARGMRYVAAWGESKKNRGAGLTAVFQLASKASGQTKSEVHGGEPFAAVEPDLPR